MLFCKKTSTLGNKNLSFNKTSFIYASINMHSSISVHAPLKINLSLQSLQDIWVKIIEMEGGDFEKSYQVRLQLSFFNLEFLYLWNL